MIEKVINGGNYQPTLTDKIVLDSTPTVNSLNGVTSDAVARAVAGASGEVPAVTENDNGKVLKAIYDEGGPAVEWAEGGSDYSAGTGIEISEQGAIGVKIDGSTITTNGEGQLVAAGGGSGQASVASGTNAIKPLNTSAMSGGYSGTSISRLGLSASSVKRLYLTRGKVSTSGYTEFLAAGGKFNLVARHGSDAKYAICEGCLAPTGYKETWDGGIEITAQLTSADITVNTDNWSMSDGSSLDEYFALGSFYYFFVTIPGTTGGTPPNGETPIDVTSVFMYDGTDESVVGVWAPVVDSKAAVEVTTSSSAGDATTILENGKIPYMTYNNVRLWYAGSRNYGLGTGPVFTGFSPILSDSSSVTVYSYTQNMMGQWVLATKTISLS